jgi:hypothetical protein
VLNIINQSFCYEKELRFEESAVPRGNNGVHLSVHLFSDLIADNN